MGDVEMGRCTGGHRSETSRQASVSSAMRAGEAGGTRHLQQKQRLDPNWGETTKAKWWPKGGHERSWPHGAHDGIHQPMRTCWHTNSF